VFCASFGVEVSHFVDLVIYVAVCFGVLCLLLLFGLLACCHCVVLICFGCVMVLLLCVL